MDEPIVDSEVELLTVLGARVHNLKNIDVALPRHSLVVITGLSGSGKSSLAFDTIYAEGQRRFMETMSAYARQFVGSMERPDVDAVEGLSPVISIEQKTTGRNPRSTVGTITEIYDFLRLLFARVGTAYSAKTGKAMVKFSEDEIVAAVSQRFDGQKLSVLAPVVRGRKGHYRELFEGIAKQGFLKVRVDGQLVDLVPGFQVDRYKVHDIEIVIDRIKIEDKKSQRLADSVRQGLQRGNGLVMVLIEDTQEMVAFSRNLMDAETGLSYEDPSPNTFSFNSPYGWCPQCQGIGAVSEVDLNLIMPDMSKSVAEGGILPLGEERDNHNFKQLRALAKKYKTNLKKPISSQPGEFMQTLLYGGDKSNLSVYVLAAAASSDSVIDIAREGLVNMMVRIAKSSESERAAQWAQDFMRQNPCPTCHGARVKPEALQFKLSGFDIGQLSQLNIRDLARHLLKIEDALTERQKLIAVEILKELLNRTAFLLNVGLDYLHLHRPAGSLSGGESQRIRLATQIGSQLTGITYILDEPSIGLHQRDNQRLIGALRNLADIGNTVLVVEHDRDIMMASDYLIDMGPGAGRLGGQIIAQGTPEEFMKQQSVTADYLSNRLLIESPAERREGNGKFIVLKGARGHNLQNVTLKLPLGCLVCVTGVSGSGKSTLISDTLYPILRQHFYDSIQRPLAYDSIDGLEHIDKVIEIDQSAIGRSPRSNPVTYTNIFADIRKLYSMVPEAKIRGYAPGRFSFNVKGGRCESCQGAGLQTIEMNFLPDVQVVCETCQGRRYNRETLEVLYKSKSINDVLNMTVEEAVAFFEPIPNIYRKIKTLLEVGLGYISLGQQATTLSGGEAQRIKLAEELSKRDTGRTLYILDEPTTGLHFDDIRLLLQVIQRLVDRGNTVVIIEHNLDVVKVSDYVIDLGPEGGSGGGVIVCAGTPEQVAKHADSHTGRFLAEELERGVVKKPRKSAKK
jgi:excinuclease ABC subunit A